MVNLDGIFSVALNLKEEEIEMIKYSNIKEIEKSVLLMKKECQKIVFDAKNNLEDALVKYREHEVFFLVNFRVIITNIEIFK